MRTFILVASFIQNILGSNWKFKITSSLAIIVLAVIALKLSFPSVWEVWAWTWYFWFTLITLLIAILAFQMGRSLRGNILLVIAILPSLIFIPKKLLASEGNKDPEVSKGAPVITEPVKPVIIDTPIGYHSSLKITHNEDYNYWVNNMGLNSKVTISGMTKDGIHIEKIITVDSKGNRDNTKCIPNIPDYQRDFRTGETLTFTHEYGGLVPIIHGEPR